MQTPLSLFPLVKGANKPTETAVFVLLHQNSDTTLHTSGCFCFTIFINVIEFIAMLFFFS